VTFLENFETNRRTKIIVLLATFFAFLAVILVKIRSEGAPDNAWCAEIERLVHNYAQTAFDWLV